MSVSPFSSPAFSGFQEPFPAAADVWAGADNEVGEQCCTALNLLNQCRHLCGYTLSSSLKVGSRLGGPSTSPSGCPSQVYGTH